MNEAISQSRSAAGRSDFWSASRRDLLTQLWNQGMSGDEIKAEFANLGITISKEAVTAKAGRMGLVSHDDHGGHPKRGFIKVRDIPDKDAHSRALSGAVARNLNIPPTIAKDQSLLERPIWRPKDTDIALVDLTDATCRWPHSGQHPFSFCGKPVLASSDKKSPYCEFHHGRAYSKPVMP